MNSRKELMSALDACHEWRELAEKRAKRIAELEAERNKAVQNARAIGLQVARIENVLDGYPDMTEFPPVAVGKARDLKAQRDALLEFLRHSQRVFEHVETDLPCPVNGCYRCDLDKAITKAEGARDDALLKAAQGLVKAYRSSTHGPNSAVLGKKVAALEEAIAQAEGARDE